MKRKLSDVDLLSRVSLVSRSPGAPQLFFLVERNQQHAGMGAVPNIVANNDFGIVLLTSNH